MKSILVAGAGISGVSAAIWLQRAGHRVTLVDREGPASGTSHGNAGVLAAGAVMPIVMPGIWKKAPGMVFDRDAPLFLRWSYLPRVLPFFARLLRMTTSDHVARYARSMTDLLGDSLAQHQSLSAGTTAARYVHAEDYCFGYAKHADYVADQKVWSLRRDNGFVDEVIAGPEYAKRDPFYAHQFETIVACKDHGRISDPGAYVRALADHFVEQGGVLLQADLQDVEMTDGQCTGLLTSEGRMTADHIVLTLGAWSGPVMRKLGLRNLAFESERGYHIELVNPSHMPKGPMMISAGKFVVTPMEGRIRCAGVVEFGGLSAPASRAPFDMLRRYIAKLLPDVTWEDEVEWMGHRPSTADSLPLIGPVDPAGKVYAGFGHQHVGLTAGPKTGRMIADMISGRRPNVDMSPFDPNRWA